MALADPLPDRLQSLQTNLKLREPRTYTGLNGYRDLVNSKLDAVIIESPPYFHPEQAAAAVAAGRHVFLAKPIAVDVPGCNSLAESGRKAQGKLSFVVDFQTRVRPAFQEAAARLHRGDIGRPVLGHVYYHSGEHKPVHIPGDSALEDRLRNWNLSKALSGDIIVEQNIHVIDVAVWYMQAHPAEAFGACSRIPEHEGDMQDTFVVNFSFPNGAQVDFSGARFLKGYNDQCIRVYGTQGTLDSHYRGVIQITGDKPWKGADADPTREGALTNVKNFVDSIRTGQYLNYAAEAVRTNLSCILGRTAGYEKRTVTWDEMMKRNEKLEAGLGI